MAVFDFISLTDKNKISDWLIGKQHFAYAKKRNLSPIHPISPYILSWRMKPG